MRNIRQNMRFRTPLHRERTVARIFAHRLIQKTGGVPYAAADQQRNLLLRRQSAGGVDGRDHGVASQHHHIHRRRRGQRRQIVLRQPAAGQVCRRQRRRRQRGKCSAILISLITSQPRRENSLAIINAACRGAKRR